MSATKREPPWLLADVGGTNVRFALAQPGTIAPLRRESIYAYRVADFATVADAARSYLTVVAAEPRHAVFAVAGPVRDEEAQLTNHAWRISSAGLREDLGLESVKLVNDFAACGMSLPLLGPDDIEPLAAGTRGRGLHRGRQTFCVLGPGTGLGVSALTMADGAVVGLEAEGGHMGFAPTSEEEMEVLRLLMQRYGRVSIERLLCGAGLVNLYEAVCTLQDVKPAAYSPAEVTAQARSQADRQALRAVELFSDVLGAVAGDFVLAYGAWDGAFLAGGVLSALSPWLHQPRFLDRFCDKGRFAPAMRNVRLSLIVHPQPGLLGAAGYAVIASGRSLVGGGEAN